MCAKAPSTTSKYSACWKKWLLWANSESNVPSFPVQPYHLCLYISHLSNVSGAKSSADSLIASVKWAHSLAGIPSPTDDPMVKTAAQGYNRLHASPVCRKEPITPDILFKLFASHYSWSPHSLHMFCFVRRVSSLQRHQQVKEKRLFFPSR